MDNNYEGCNNDEVLKLVQYRELTNNFVNSKTLNETDFDDLGFEFKNTTTFNFPYTNMNFILLH